MRGLEQGSRWGAGVGRSMSAVLDKKKCWGLEALCEASQGRVLGWLGGADLWNGSPNKGILEDGAVKIMDRWRMRWSGGRSTGGKEVGGALGA